MYIGLWLGSEPNIFSEGYFYRMCVLLYALEPKTVSVFIFRTHMFSILQSLANSQSQHALHSLNKVYFQFLMHGEQISTIIYSEH